LTNPIPEQGETMPATTSADGERSRNLLYMAEPKRWSAWPFLPLIRHTQGGEDDYECGVLFDLMGLHSMPGFGATVFFTNLFTLPPTLDELLALEKEVYDTPEEVFAAGWRVD
jgi:hypothetical protein